LPPLCWCCTPDNSRGAAVGGAAVGVAAVRRASVGGAAIGGAAVSGQLSCSKYVQFIASPLASPLAILVAQRARLRAIPSLDQS